MYVYVCVVWAFFVPDIHVRYDGRLIRDAVCVYFMYVCMCVCMYYVGFTCSSHLRYDGRLLVLDTIYIELQEEAYPYTIN